MFGSETGEVLASSGISVGVMLTEVILWDFHNF